MEEKKKYRNRHIKIINGHEYWYESVRVKGKKNPTTRYIAPIQRVRKPRNSDE